MKKLWDDYSELPKFNKLENDIQTDVLIIGGGLAGILCAYKLQQSGVSYVLIESDRICQGVTAGTTAKISTQHGLIYDKIVSNYNIDKAKLYFEANNKALLQYKDICSNIDCDFELKDFYVYSVEDVAKLERELKTLQIIGCEATYVSKLPIPVNTCGAVLVKQQAQFNPLKFVSHISKTLNIYENTVARAYDGKSVVTDFGKITASKIIVATHFPFINKHGSYFLKMYQHRSYVTALENVPNINGMYIDENLTGFSFRNYNGMLLLGGGSHRTGKYGGGWDELTMFYTKHYPNSKPKYRWATQDCMTLDGIAYIGQYSKNTPDLYVATGFNKWGMTLSMAAADILCDMVQDKQNPYTELFSTSRTIIHPQLFINVGESLVNLLSLSKPRCTHMGCALKWNYYEHTWDCTCHGSRFTESGKVINNPATDDLNK